MKHLSFNYHGKKLQISQVSGAASECPFCNVMLDNFYQGSIWKTELYGWQHSLGDVFPEDDLKKLIGYIEKATG